MSRRLDATFAKLRAQGRTALVPYVMTGDPSIAVTLDVMHALVDAGADVIELGVPFSDPMADGPVIQRAGERALAHGTGLKDVLGVVRSFREKDAATPVVLMGYANPIEAMGIDAFGDRARDAGVDGLLVVDYPPEESRDFATAMHARGLATIYLLSPTTPESRIAAAASLARGFVYYVSLKGVTGAASMDLPALSAHVALIRTQCRLPIGVGFGIKDAQTARDVARFSDAVVIGSALVREIAGKLGDADAIVSSVRALIAEIRASLDARQV